jgi:hypothetical protein
MIRGKLLSKVATVGLLVRFAASVLTARLHRPKLAQRSEDHELANGNMRRVAVSWVKTAA